MTDRYRVRSEEGGAAADGGGFTECVRDWLLGHLSNHVGTTQDEMKACRAAGRRPQEKGRMTKNVKKRRIWSGASGGGRRLLPSRSRPRNRRRELAGL